MRFKTNFWVIVIASIISLILPMLVLAMGTSHSTADVLYFGTTDVVPNSSSKLTRNNNGISMNIKTTDLEAGAAYTIWWVIFNNPENCSDGECGENDVLPPGVNPDADVSVAFAAGHVIGNNGKGNFGGHLSVGDTSGLHPAFLDTNGLVDAHGAEIHLIVRNHGQPIPGEVSEQISTFFGGCPLNILCSDEQASIHLP